MKIEHMNEFIVLTKTLNFTKAAEELYITQPVLSRHISAMETELGTLLFDRSTHGVRLTSTGKKTLKIFKQIVDKYTTLQKQTNLAPEGLIGKINLGVLYYSFDTLIAPIVKQMGKLYPKIELKILSYQPNGLMEELMSDVIDVGISYSHYSNDNPSLTYKPLFREEFIIMHRSDHPFSQKETLNLSDLNGQTFLFLKDNKWFHQFLVPMFQENHINIIEQYISDNADMLFVEVREIGGIAIVPAHMSVIQRKGISYSKLNDNISANLDLGIIYKTDNQNPAISLFIKASKQGLSEIS